MPDKETKKRHRWKNFQLDDKDALDLEDVVKDFEKSVRFTKPLNKLLNKYNVVYHPFYFTRIIPGRGK